MAYTSPLHEHCENCFNVKTCKQVSCPPYSCDLVSCDCGVKLHQCKLNDHYFICSNEKVPCINKGNGCEAVLLRNDLGSHLSKCPASVVYCTMEWNRWPVYSQERKAKVPFSKERLHARYGQLDVTLALRDQRMLNTAMKAPRSTRRALRNSLTKRFPAVPFVQKQTSFETDPHFSQDSTSTSCTISDDDSDTPWQQRKNPPGLSASMCNELVKATKTTTEKLSAALSLIPSKNNKNDLHKEQEQQRMSVHSSANEADIKCVYCMRKQAMKSSEYKHTCDMYKSLNVQCNTDEVLSPSVLSPESTSSQEDFKTYEDFMKENSQEDIMNKNLDEVVLDHLDIGLHTIFTNPSRNVVPDPPNPGLMLSEILGLDLNMERITRYQAKPASMYTFLCAQAFRRDEYPWHFRNLHGDIHSGMNGWLEQRCPLSAEGCTYSQRRLYPNTPGTEIVYSDIVESFGIKPPSQPCPTRASMEREYMEYMKKTKRLKEPTPEIYTSKDFDAYVQVNGSIKTNQTLSGDGGHSQPVSSICDHNNRTTVAGGQPESGEPCDISLHCDLFTQLPNELLLKIARYLDGFSLNQLSVTSYRLRTVCEKLLPERGLVLQEWRRDNKNHWYINSQRWQFSSCFEPVHHWGFLDNKHMSEHLKSCPFNVKHEHSRDQPVLAMITDPERHNQEAFQTVMNRMYPEWNPAADKVEHKEQN